MHFTEHLVGAFGKSPRESNSNLESFAPVTQELYRLLPAMIHTQELYRKIKT
jgi:hypothetical protein